MSNRAWPLGRPDLFCELLCLFAAGLLAAVGAERPAFADKGECGQPYSIGVNPALTDAQFILATSVSLRTCDLCECDVNDSGTITAMDALRDLRLVVGLPVTLHCPPCVDTTTTSTSSTSTGSIPVCPPADALDDVLFNEIYTCSQKFTGQAKFCADLNEGDQLRFHHKGSGVYQVTDEPDSGFVYSGTLSCTTFTWTALSPGEYTESGTWEFDASLAQFSGSSTYQAIGGTYAGNCNETGARAPTIPPNPPTVAPCP